MTPQRTHRLAWAAARALLTIGAAVGVLVILGVAASALLSIRPVVLTSGSMEPAMATGSVALIRATPARDVSVGEVVTVETQTGSRVTHRVVATDRLADGAVALRLKGDANDTPDAETYRPDEVGVVLVDVPLAGYLISALRTPVGIFALGVLATVLVGFVLLGGDPRAARRPRFRRRPGATAAAVLVIAAALGWPTLRPLNSEAAFTDPVDVTGSAYTAHAVVAQGQPTCEDVDGVLILGNVARLGWTQVDARYEYEWELRNMGGVAVASGAVGGAQAPGSTVRLDIGTGLIGTNANYNVLVRARLAATASWKAPTTTSTPVRRASILIIGAAMRCGHA